MWGLDSTMRCPGKRRRPRQTFTKEVERLLGRRVRNISLYAAALTHRSATRNYRECYEQLEWLGDAVLQLAVSEALLETYPWMREGWLTQTRSGLVRWRVLARLTELTGLSRLLRVAPGAPIPPKVLGDVFEAFVAAIFLDLGWQAAARFVHDTFDSFVTVELV